jgi:DNA-binding NtrC family response regulator
MDDMPTRSATLLVVDDDADMRKLLARVLTNAGYNVMIFDSPGTALDALQTGAHVDLLITDLEMHTAMSGLDLADAARSYAPDLPIILVTGSPTAASFPNVTAVLRKPFRLMELELVVRRCLAAR